jgi:hypothetical protein
MIRLMSQPSGTVLLAVRAAFVRRLLEFQLQGVGFRVEQVSTCEEIAVRPARGGTTLLVEATTLNRRDDWKAAIATCPEMGLVIVGVADLDRDLAELLEGRRGVHLRNPLNRRQMLRTLARVRRRRMRKAKPTQERAQRSSAG